MSALLIIALQSAQSLGLFIH